MTNEVLAKTEWRSYFKRYDEILAGTEVRIEVASPALGDQVLVERAALLGLTYEAREDVLSIVASNHSHIVKQPREISVHEVDGRLQAMRILDQEGRQQILTFFERHGRS
ncbi:DUF5335 family protein [Rhizobium sp. BK376]|uniref:DUF5335 family protein n=1 Tax=Rhizobium sp. BK376 TaxID=2512149 RepID=UPI001050AB73|nr:DUF5335 family protein [Rhizobium sp. BK376]TCR75611.1 hypothetical protein EV561_12250 [Rhizobium sp. BK376]